MVPVHYSELLHRSVTVKLKVVYWMAASRISEFVSDPHMHLHRSSTDKHKQGLLRVYASEFLARATTEDYDFEVV